MKRLCTLLVLCLLVLPPVARADEPSPDDLYFDVYTLMLKAETLQGKGRAEEARTNYLSGLKILKQIQLDFPEWQPKVIKYRISYFEGKATPPPAAKPVPAPRANAPAASAVTETTAAATTAADTSDAPVEMKIKWTTGKRYVARLSVDADADVAPTGQQPQKGQLNFTQGVALSVLKERDGGGKELEVELLDTTANLKVNGATMFGYDINQPAQNGMVPQEVVAVVQKLKGSKVKLITDADGKISSVEGVEDLVKRLAAAGDPNANPEDILKNIPADATGNLKEAFANMSGLPDKPVKIGDTWAPKMDAIKGMPEGSQMNYTYSFKGWEQHDGKRCALIQVAGDFNVKPGAGTPQGMPAVKARISGKIWFDPALNMVVESSMKPDITITMTTMLPGAAPSSTAIGLHLTTDTKLMEVTDLAQ